MREERRERGREGAATQKRGGPRLGETVERVGGFDEEGRGNHDGPHARVCVL